MPVGIQIPILSLDCDHFRTCRDTVEDLVLELEGRLRSGEPILFDTLAEPADALFAIPEVYGHAKPPPNQRARNFRDEWIARSLEEFSLFLRDPVASFNAESASSPDEFQVLHDGSVIPMRLDQLVSARVWGIEIRTSDSESRKRVAHRILTAAVRRLASCISWVGKMTSGIVKGTVNPDRIEWRADDLGIRFEHLVAAILNHETEIARRSNLFEDLFEWTDLRVHYRDIPRRSGCRIQVKLSPGDGQARPRRRLNIETHVVFGPRQLADFIDRSVEEGHHADLLRTLWLELGEKKPADCVDLANLLHQIFRTSMEAISHPLGPIASIPLAIQELSRRFVRQESALAFERMRSRTEGNPNPPPWTRRI